MESSAPWPLARQDAVPSVPPEQTFPVQIRVYRSGLGVRGLVCPGGTGRLISFQSRHLFWVAMSLDG